MVTVKSLPSKKIAATLAMAKPKVTVSRPARAASAKSAPRAKTGIAIAAERRVRGAFARDFGIHFGQRLLRVHLLPPLLRFVQLAGFFPTAFPDELPAQLMFLFQLQHFSNARSARGRQAVRGRQWCLRNEQQACRNK